MGRGENFDAWAEAVNIAICLTTDKGKIIHLNSVMEELSGRVRDEALDLQVASFFDEDDQDRIANVLHLMADGVSSVGHVEARLRRKSGRQVPVEITAKLLPRGGRNFVVFSFVDLSRIIEISTEKLAAERALSRTSKLADIGKLTAGIAHELNNPLTIVMGFAENLQLLLHEGFSDAAELRRQVDPIVRASDRMARIISTMMKLIRNDNILNVRFDLSDIAGSAIAHLEPTFAASGIELRTEGLRKASIVGDPGQIEQIIVNILKNAAQALADTEGERIIKVSVTDETSPRLHVWNNGPAIPDEHRDRVMTPFFTTKEVGEGVGLGLALSHWIMRAHDGDLGFTSSAAEGTDFVLTFPQQKTPAEQSRPAGTVLIIEPNDADRVALRGKLGFFGYATIEARSGLEGLEKIKDSPEVFCVFTEMKMPQFDGLEFIKMARQIRESLRFVIVTEHSSDKTTSLRARRLGIDGFLEKPIDPVQFSLTIHDLEKSIAERQSA